ncbi:hypothetical protein [Adhaeribacter rhizoryzae]|uniref:hypothetical protein n=1 Tax=Adhaeribacter rhizoryzae TaxID=2607907 RepID=UPI00167FE0DD|nr:hypothetical protein [Adhaeribacter rhizoryzae]
MATAVYYTKYDIIGDVYLLDAAAEARLLLTQTVTFLSIKIILQSINSQYFIF